MSRLNILYQFDDKYAPFAGISMTSLLQNNRNHEIVIYCAGMEVSSLNRERIERTVQLEKQKLIWMDVRAALEQINKLNVGSWNGSIATWIKMFILDDFPQDTERVLYLDCDTIVMDDISYLFDLEMEQYPIGAVLDSVAQYNKSRFDLQCYYNAGVMLINLAFFRKNHVSTKMLKHLNENLHKYLINDQDLMNDYFRDDIYCLPMQYNLQGFQLMYAEKNYFKVYNEKNYYKKEDVVSAKQNPKIIHFFRIFGSYPWEQGNCHVNKTLYEDWKKKSLWENMPNSKHRLSVVFIIERILYQVIPERTFLILYRKIVEN